MSPQRSKLFLPGQCKNAFGQRHLQILSPTRAPQKAGKPRFFCFLSFLFGPGYRPRSFHSRSTRFLTSACIAIARPHAREVSAGHLFVASIPIFEPSPPTGLPKSG